MLNGQRDGTDAQSRGLQRTGAGRQGLLVVVALVLAGCASAVPVPVPSPLATAAGSDALPASAASVSPAPTGSDAVSASPVVASSASPTSGVPAASAAASSAPASSAVAAPPSAVPTPPPAASLPPRSWSAAAVPGSMMFGAAAVGDRAYLFGAAGATAAVWTGTDGSTWTAAQGLPKGWVSGLAGGPGGMVAVGCRRGTTAIPCGGPLLLWSADGLSWSQVAVPADLRMAALERVVWTGSRFIVAGTACTTATTPGCSALMAVITSADGRNWSRAVLPDNRAYESLAIVSAAGRVGVLGMNSVWWTKDEVTWTKDAQVADGAEIMVSVDEGASATAAASTLKGIVILRSTDLVHWSAVAPPSLSHGSYAWALLRTGSGYVMVASDANGLSQILASPDGVAWRDVGPAKAPLGVAGGALTVDTVIVATDSGSLSFPLPLP
jgi:hypothetical protein